MCQVNNLEAIRFFQLAVEKDPRFAMAHVGLADVHAWLGFFTILPPREAFARAQAATREARDADPALADAYASLGFVALLYDWDWPGAERKLRQAIELDPNYAPARYWHAWLLAVLGRRDEATAEIEQAARLEPSSVLVMAYVGFTFYLLRRYDAAIEQFRNALQRQPDFNVAHWWLGVTLTEKGEYEDAITELQKALECSGGHPSPLAALANLYGRLGWVSDQKNIVAELTQRSRQKYVSSFDLLVCHAGSKDNGPALEWLGKAVDERSSFLVFAKIWPAFENLREDPRFADVLRPLGLPD